MNIYCDGGSRGNPGPAASGAVLVNDAGEVVEVAQEYLGTATNNVAEYHAVILGLGLMRKHELTSMEFLLDSQLVVRQLNGQYRVKHPDMKVQFDKVQRLLHGLDVRFRHIPRAENHLSDTAVNQCLDAHSTK